MFQATKLPQVYLSTPNRLTQGWPSYGAWATCGKLNDLKWRNAYLQSHKDSKPFQCLSRFLLCTNLYEMTAIKLFILHLKNADIS